MSLTISLLAAFAGQALAGPYLHPRQSLASSAGPLTVLFQNNGNWSEHVTRPSALLVNKLSSYEDASAVCASYGENLLDCASFGDYADQFNYQKYLGNFADDQLLWSSCNQSSPTFLNGTQGTASTGSGFPFVCTNNAPTYTSVNSTLSDFPRANVTSNGTTFEGYRDHMAFRFVGVPYAQPPIGKLRFTLPVPANYSSVVNATAYGPSCPQFGYFNGDAYGLNPWGNSEDCLYLNVFTPHIPDPSSTITNASASLKPVMLWLHGGGSTQGTGSDGTFDGASLASRADVVVVTINYRLNIFGGLSLDDGIITGNYMLADKILALQWVQDYITGFGGNPSNVTVFGQSAGASSVIDLLLAPQAAGLFSGGIIQSGGNGHTMKASTAAAAILPLIQPYCNSTGVERLECLQALPMETLLNMTNTGGVTTWRTVIDGIYALDYPVSQVALGAQYINSVNLIAGFMPEEYQSLGTTVLAPNASDFSEAIATLVAKTPALNQNQADAVLASGLWLVSNETATNGSTSYSSVYNASINAATDAFMTCSGAELATIGAAANAYKSMWLYEHQRGYALSYYNFYNLGSFPVGHPRPYYRCHSGDLYEVFGTYYLYDQPVREPQDIYYTNAIMDMWGSFAKTGNPNVDAAYLEARGYESSTTFFENWQWPEFTIIEPQVASLQYPEAGLTTLPDQEHCRVLNPFMTVT